MPIPLAFFTHHCEIRHPDLPNYCGFLLIVLCTLTFLLFCFEGSCDGYLERMEGCRLQILTRNGGPQSDSVETLFSTDSIRRKLRSQLQTVPKRSEAEA